MPDLIVKGFLVLMPCWSLEGVTVLTLQADTQLQNVAGQNAWLSTHDRETVSPTGYNGPKLGCSATCPAGTVLDAGPDILPKGPW
jgi:hypothetical protein